MLSKILDFFTGSQSEDTGEYLPGEAEFVTVEEETYCPECRDVHLHRRIDNSEFIPKDEFNRNQYEQPYTLEEYNGYIKAIWVPEEKDVEHSDRISAFYHPEDAPPMFEVEDGLTPSVLHFRD